MTDGRCASTVRELWPLQEAQTQLTSTRARPWRSRTCSRAHLALRALHARTPACWRGTLRSRALCNGVRAGGPSAMSWRTSAWSARTIATTSSAADRPRPSTSSCRTSTRAMLRGAPCPVPVPARAQPPPASRDFVPRRRTVPEESSAGSDRAGVQWRGTGSTGARGSHPRCLQLCACSARAKWPVCSS